MRRNACDDDVTYEARVTEIKKMFHVQRKKGVNYRIAAGRYSKMLT